MSPLTCSLPVHIVSVLTNRHLVDVVLLLLLLWFRVAQGKVDWSLLLLFTPMWACVLLAGTLRCITPPHPQVRRASELRCTAS